jgi:hypothetical protein
MNDYLKLLTKNKNKKTKNDLSNLKFKFFFDF